MFLSLGIFTNTVDAYVSVDGYYKANGTYVAPYVRSNPNGVKYDNYGYTPSQGLYNSTYGTRGSSWDTPTYITDPNYYQGKSIYESGNSTYSYPSYSGYSYSAPATPTCPLNSYADGSSCKCSYGYAVSGSSCVSQDSLCRDQLGYSSSYNSLNNNCKCNSGYVIGTSGKCTSASSYCSDKIGLMSQYNSSANTCECMYGYELVGSSCTYKSTSYAASAYSSYYTPKSSNTQKTTTSCPANSYASGSSCYCSSGYQISSDKSSCVIIPTNTNNQACVTAYSTNSYWDGTKTSDGKLNCGCKTGSSWNSTKTSCATNKYIPTAEDNKVTGKNYYLTNRTCVGLSGDQYGECISYALNH